MDHAHDLTQTTSAPTPGGSSSPCGAWSPHQEGAHLRPNNDDYVELERRLVLRNLAMTADKLARMSMAASIGSGLSEADYGLFSRSLEDMSGCIHQLCRAFQLQEPSLVPGGGLPDQSSPQPGVAAIASAATSDEYSEAGAGFKKHRQSTRVRPDKACLECGRRDTAQWRRGPLGVSTLCNACGIRHARVMKKVMRQQGLRLGSSPGCTPPLPDEAEDSQQAASPVVQQVHHQPHHREEWPGLNSDDERESTVDHLLHAGQQQAARSSVYDLLN